MIIVPSLRPDAVVHDHDDDDTATANDTAHEHEHEHEHEEYDACEEVMYRQAALLRHWRQLERDDDALRQQQQEGESDSDTDTDDDDDPTMTETLSYDNYLQHQQEGMYDDYKHVNYRYIEFDLLEEAAASSTSLVVKEEEDEEEKARDTSRRLIIAQDRTVGKGGFVWDAGYILAQTFLRNYYYQQQQQQQQQKQKQSTNHQNPQPNNTPLHIIELGAGTGITSLLIAKSLLQNKNDTAVSFHLTDLPELQPLLQQNCVTNFPHQTNTVTHGVLEWGSNTNTTTAHTYDVILGADVVTSIYSADKLAHSLYALSTNAHTQIYIAYRERVTGMLATFLTRMHTMFAVVDTTTMPPNSTNHNPTVVIIYLTGKKTSPSSLPTHNTNTNTTIICG